MLNIVFIAAPKEQKPHNLSGNRANQSEQSGK